MEYPYTKEWFPIEEYTKMCYEVATLPPEKIPRYYREERLAGVFVDPVRALCRRGNEPVSPYAEWATHRTEIEALFSTPAEQDEELYRRVSGCSSFFPHVLIKYIKRYGATSVFDPCGGWLERLIACILVTKFSGRLVSYTGVDPNALLQYPYRQVLNYFGVAAKDFRYIQSGIETVQLGAELYDLVFTSPPFWTIELYGNDSAQSTNIRSLRAWTVNFLLVMLDKAWQHLRPGGHMCIYLAVSERDKETLDYVRVMEDYMRTHLDCKQLPSETYLLQHSPSIYIWQKSSTVELSPTVPLKPINRCFVPETMHGGVRSLVIDAFLRSYPAGSRLAYALQAGDESSQLLAEAVNRSKNNLHLTIYASYKPRIDASNRITVIVDANPVAALDHADSRLERIPRNINSPIMEGLLFAKLRAVLYHTQQNPPEVVWIKIGSGLTLSVLMRIWPRAHFNCVLTPGHPTVRDKPLAERRRLTEYYNDGRKSLIDMRSEHGTIKDYCF